MRPIIASVKWAMPSPAMSMLSRTEARIESRCPTLSALAAAFDMLAKKVPS